MQSRGPERLADLTHHLWAKTGEHSPAFILRLTDRLEELLSNVERIEIPDASHRMHEENAPAVNDAILEFIGPHRDEPTAPR
jgi:pimeloyl-ACP methyl ester carboxylesterase